MNAPGPSPKPLRAAADADAEPAAVAARYARRGAADRYSLLNADVWQAAQERERVLLRLFARHGWHDLARRRLLEVGSGSGANLLEMLRLGFAPGQLAGVELLAERHALARAVLPEAVALHHGDASRLEIVDASQDAVLAATVFSSLLDEDFQARLASVMWRWVKPGGCVLWYDFTVDNPRNPDVRGVPLARVAALFPEARIEAHRVTLAPPIARAVCRLHPSLYTACNLLPFLRTHLLCWLAKPA